MTGFTNTAEAAILNDADVGLGRTLYLHLFKWTGTAGQGAGKEPLDDGTVGSGAAANVAAVSGGGYAPKAIASSDWSTATGGAPTVKQLPKSGGAAIRWDASGANFGELVAFAITTSAASAAYDAAACICSGPLTDGSGTPTYVTVNDGDAFEITDSNPILVRLGDPALVTDATAGSQRTAPI